MAIVKTNGINQSISRLTYSSEGQSALLPTSVTTRLGLQALARACSIHVGTFSKDLRLLFYVFMFVYVVTGRSGDLYRSWFREMAETG